MKVADFCILTTLLAVTFIISSCGAAPTTSQLHLLGADTQRIPLAEAPAGIVRLIIYAIPTHHLKTRLEHTTTDIARLLHRSACYGSYITKGAVLTAKHCVENDDETTVMIELRFLSGHILYLKSPHPSTNSNTTFTSILHPKADLALLVFDAQTLQPPPHTVQLAHLPDNEHQQPHLYTEAVTYGSGGTNEHPNYPDDFHPDSSHIRVARGIYVINQHHPKGRDYLDHIDLHPSTKKYLTYAYNHSCHHPLGWKLIRNIVLCNILGINGEEDGPLLIITAHLRAPNISLTAPTPREALFCKGDSGSGVLDSSGKLIGVIVGIHPTHKKYVSQDEAGFPFDPIATTKAKCRHIAMAADLHKHKNWIETTLRSAL